MARSAVALHRLLDLLPAFEGDHRVERRFCLVPGSDFGLDALTSLDRAGALTVPWDLALTRSYDLIVAASPKGDLHLLDGPLALLPHGAGFNKTVDGEGSHDSASGLDPDYLLHDGEPIATVHALSHAGQVAQLAVACPPAASRAVVVGDPTHDRIQEYVPLRDRYRAALGTGDRRLVVLLSTWGRESLLERRPGLAERLCAELPVDEYQLAVVAHPNTHSDPGTFDLAARLPREVFLARPHEEWAALLIAADAVVTDHGSTALYFAAAEDRPVLAAYDGGTELLPGTPMDVLLGSVPRLAPAGSLAAALAAYRPGSARAAVSAAFDPGARDAALARLRDALYPHLGLTPPDRPAEPLPLPAPRRPVAPPPSFGVRVDFRDGRAHVERRPARVDDPAPHHLAAEADAVGERAVRGAALLYRRLWRGGPTPEEWTAGVLTHRGVCRTAAVILGPDHCVVRRLDDPDALTDVRLEPLGGAGDRSPLPDPGAVLSAVHAVLGRGEGGAVTDFVCRVGPRVCRVRLNRS
ncbi:hypothetical protein OK074_8720 [Actinobacteria bacterium OK074]|nr:hypothetical protein OK074_8720 [Actinobacteria bacterium OK074]